MSPEPVLPFDASPDTRGIGDNSGAVPDAVRQDFEARVATFLKGADVWSQRDTLDDDTAPRARDFHAGLKQLLKQAEEGRKKEKQPWMDGAKRVDDAWSAIKSKIEKASATIEPKIRAFLEQKDREERRRQAEAKRVAHEAEEARLAAEIAAAAAATESGRIEAETRAEQLKKAEAAAARAAKPKDVKVESATGLATRAGLRTQWDCRLTNTTRAMLDLCKRHPDKFEDLVRQLALAELRAAPTVDGQKQLPVIPGVEFVASKSFGAAA